MDASITLYLAEAIRVEQLATIRRRKRRDRRLRPVVGQCKDEMRELNAEAANRGIGTAAKRTNMAAERLTSARPSAEAKFPLLFAGRNRRLK